MVLEVQQKPTTLNSNVPVQTGSNTNVSVSIFNENGATDVTNEPVNVAAPENVNKVLYEKLKDILKNNNITLSSNELVEIILKVGGKSEAELLNIEQSEIDRIAEIIENSISVLKYKKIEINTKSIIDMSKHLKIMVDNGWSLKGAVNDVENNSKQESMADKLRRVWPGVFTADYNFTDPANKEQIKEYVQEYIRLYHKTEKLSNTDWAKMLACSKNDNERDVFDGILQEIDPQYRAKFVQSWLYSYEKDENRINAANRVDILAATESTSDEDTQLITHTVRSNQNETGIVESDNVIYETVNKFFEEKGIKELIKKVKEQGIESLDDKERELYTQWTHYQSIIKGGYTGTVANQNVDTEFKETHLRDFVNPQIYNYGEDTYKEIIEYVKSYYKEHKYEFNMDLKDFETLMNNATSGNYDNVVNGNPIVDPSTVTNNSSTSSNDSISTSNGMFATVTEAELAQQVQKVLSLKKEAPKEETPVLVKGSFDNQVLANGNNVDWINEQIKDNGIVKFTREVLNSSNARGSIAFDKGLNFLERCVGGFKEVMYAVIHNTTNACIALRESFSDNELKDVKAQNVYVAQQLKKMQKDNA